MALARTCRRILDARLGGEDDWGRALRRWSAAAASGGASTSEASSGPRRAKTSARATSTAPSTSSSGNGDLPALPELKWNPPRYYAYPPRHAPWTPSQELDKRKNYFKRGAHIVQVLEAEYKNKLAEELPYKVPHFRAGHYLRLTLDDGSTRPEVAKVLVIGRRNRGPRSSFQCLRAHGDEVWYEHYPLYCPEVKKIEVVGLMPNCSTKSKLYYLWTRDATPAKVGLESKADQKQAQELRVVEKRREKSRGRAQGGAPGGGGALGGSGALGGGAAPR